MSTQIEKYLTQVAAKQGLLFDLNLATPKTRKSFPVVKVAEFEINHYNDAPIVRESLFFADVLSRYLEDYSTNQLAFQSLYAELQDKYGEDVDSKITPDELSQLMLFSSEAKRIGQAINIERVSFMLASRYDATWDFSDTYGLSESELDELAEYTNSVINGTYGQEPEEDEEAGDETEKK